MKISPAMKEFRVPGTRTGNRPAPIVSARSRPDLQPGPG
jgi:hypothetical protein